MQSLQRPRDKGRFIPGQLIRGSSEPRLTPASIPSKAKITILYKDSDTAFGSASLRFSRSSDIKVGPGEYNLNINPENPSYSKKGFGPLISKWSNSDRVFRNRGPGPSDYKGRQSQFLSKGSQKRAIKFGKSETHGSFWEETRHMIDNPGPFEYNQIRISRPLNVSQTSFNRSTKRWKRKEKQQTPTATTYHPQDSLIHRRSRVIALQQTLPVTKKMVIESLFGKDREKRGPGEYQKEPSIGQPLKILQTSGFRFSQQPIVNIQKITAICPQVRGNESLGGSLSARPRLGSHQEFDSTLSISGI